MTSLRLPALPWEKYFGGFDTLVAGTAPVFWAFFLLTGISVFVLRNKDRGIQRPFTAPLYPVVPLIFCLMCGYMLYSSIDYAGWLSLLGIVPLAIGVPLYFLSRQTNPAPAHTLPPVSESSPQEAS
jgi:amino acid transporter